MNTEHVKEFLTFCSTMNYSEAARELYCSRSALRQHIADLESELGVPLVETTPWGLKLTVFGQRFKPEAEKVAQLARDLSAEMRAMKENLLVVRVSSSSLAWLRSVLFGARAAVMEAHPGKEILISTVAGTMTSLEALFDGTSDLAVFRVKAGTPVASGEGPLDGVRVFKVASERIEYFAGMANPVSKLEKVTPADLAGRRLLLTRDIYESLHGPFATNMAPWPFGMEVVTRDFNDYQEYYAGEFDDVIGSVPARFKERYGFDERPDLRVFAIEGIDLRSDFYAAATERYLANPVARAFFDEMERMAHEKSE